MADKKPSLIGKLPLGTRVRVIGNQYEGQMGHIKYLGNLEGVAGEWIGLQLDQQKGSHSGEYKSKSYFVCKANHGMFVKAKSLTLEDGTLLEQILNNPNYVHKKGNNEQENNIAATIGKINIPKKESNNQAPLTKREQDKKGAKKDVKKPQSKQPPMTSRTTVTQKSTIKGKQGKKQEKLEDEITNSLNEKIAELQEQLKKSEEQLKTLKQTDLHKEKELLSNELATLQEEYRVIKNSKDKIEYKIDESKEDKIKKYQQEMEFFKKQKQNAENQNKKLLNKIKDLEQALEQTAQYADIIEKMTENNVKLENKNQSLKIELENAKTELKNIKVSKTATQAGEQSEQELRQQLITLNQTVVLLQSELNDKEERLNVLTQQSQENKKKLQQFNKMQKKLKKLEGEVAQLKQSLEQNSDAVSFAETLTIRNQQTEDELIKAKNKINELLNEKDFLQQVQQSHEELAKQLEHEIYTKQLQIEKFQQVISEKDGQIEDQKKQINKYKEKLNSLLKQNQSVVSQKQIDPLETSMVVSQAPSNYNNLQYIQMLKYTELINQKYIRLQNDFTLIKNKVGMFLLNILEGLPAQFIQKFYPEGIELMILIKTGKDKLYYLFDEIFSQLRQKNQLYSEQNFDLCNWMIMLLISIEKAFRSLYRLELLISVCDVEEQLANIVTKKNIKEEASLLELTASTLLIQLAENNVSASISLDRFDQATKSLEEEIHNIEKQSIKSERSQKKLDFQNQMKINLCSQTMKTITYSCEMILNYKVLSELKQNAQIDITFEGFLKKMAEYLKQLCLNPHVRYNKAMVNYSEGIKLINETFKQIESQNLIHQMENLNSKSDHINLLKQTILVVQVYTKELILDLGKIIITNQLHRFKTKLPGQLWQNKISFIRDQLIKIKQLNDQKNDLEAALLEAKKKIFLQEKEIKDRGIVKQLLEKRIGELQLKVEQVVLLENEIKRLKEKVKNLQEGGKAMEEQIENLLRKKAQNEQELKRLKQKSQSQANQINTRPQAVKHNHSSIFNPNNISVKNLLKENSTLRNCQLKEKINMLKHSELLNLGKDQPFDEFKNIRRKALKDLVDTKIIDPSEPIPENSSDRLFLELESIIREKAEKPNFKLVEIGAARVYGENPLHKCEISKFKYSQLKNFLPEIINI